MGSVEGSTSSASHSENGTNGTYNSWEGGSTLEQIIAKSGVDQKIRIRNPKKVESLIEEIIFSGQDDLQVITDFDATLSCYHANGKRCATSYGVISSSHIVPDNIRAQGAALYEKYYPYENDVSVTKEERASKLAEWYDKKHENYIDAHLKVGADDVEKLVKQAHLVLRDGSQDVLKKLHSCNIPTLIFSAGSGDSVVEVLRFNKVDFPTSKVIANFMIIDEKTRELVGFSKPYIHPGNKNETVFQSDPYFESLKNRHNAILLGDNVGDVEMCMGMPQQNAVLKIGYLNFNIEQQLETFMDVFDIVLIDDQTFHFMDALVDLIIAKKEGRSNQKY